MDSYRFGINVKEYCRQHEAYVESRISRNACTLELLKLHQEKISWLQHERLIHLIVTAMCTMIELFLVDLSVLHQELGILPPILMLAMLVLLGFYYYHYFFLENRVQRWYRLADIIRQNIDPPA